MNDQKVIGIVGGGQLGRMLTLAALPLGFKVVVVDPGENCPAAQAGAEQILGSLRDEKTLLQLARKADYITVEIEHLDAEVLEKIVEKGGTVNPAPSTIKLIQDKFKQKEFLQKNGLPIAPFYEITDLEQAKNILEKLCGSMLLKTRHNAYDGRGNALIKNANDLQEAMTRFADTPLYAEKVVNFTKELAVMVAKDMAGKTLAYPVVETVHERNICLEVLAPAQVPKDVANKAVSLSKRAVSHLQGAGMYGVEMFLQKDGSVLINEIAPRVHNSGHYTMNGCTVSQFEQHIRAITGLPLENTELSSPAAVMINILGERNGPTRLRGLGKTLAIQGTAVHIYGKSPTKVDRKMGHINAVGLTIKQARAKARKARKSLDI